MNRTRAYGLGLVVIVALGFLMVQGLGNATEYFRKADEAVAQVAKLGDKRFRLAGHDRGARVAHRLCLDHPHAVERVAVLDISPTRIMYEGTDKAFATAYYHWFFLIQPFDLPERLIGADPIYYLHKKLAGWSSGCGADTSTPCLS